MIGGTDRPGLCSLGMYIQGRTLRLACSALAFLTVGAAVARPQGKGPARAPVRAPAPVSAPAPRTFTLKNGMRVTFIRTGTARRAFVSLVLETGEIDEPSFGPGLASLTADMLLQGTLARSAQQITNEAAALDTKLAVRAGPISTSVSGDVPTAGVPRLLSLVGDIVRHPLLDAAGFERVRRNALRVLDSTLQNPADRARQQWRAIIFPDGPYGQPYSYAATLRMLQLGHVRNVFDDSYAAARAHLYVSGAFDFVASEKVVRGIFSDWKAGSPAPPHAIRSATVHELVVADQPGAARSVTWIGLPTIDPEHPDFAKLEVADMLIAGGDSSRVAIDLASIEGTAPHGSSTLWQRRHATYWADVLDIRTVNTGAALGALLGELSSLIREAPSAAEVARARAGVIAAVQARDSSRDGLVALVEFMDEHSLGQDWRAEHLRRVMAVTPEDVRAAVESFLDPTRMAIVVVGDRALIEPQLAKLRPLVP
ncbi:MAG TPA: pitrilysin family protein [Gemmatimonadaceae bacterium]